MNWAWFPENVSKSGHVVDDLFWLAFALTAAAFVAVLAFLGTFLVRYRARAGRAGYYTLGESPKAVALTLALAVLVFLVIDVNLALHDHHAWNALWAKPDPASALRIRVEPEQFVWNARYAGADGAFDTGDDVTVINDIHIPLDRPVIVDLRSKDVIHSFFLPNFRVKQDAVPGFTTHMTFEAAKTGVYDIVCAELCGLGHYRMAGKLTVESADRFAAWLANGGKTA